MAVQFHPPADMLLDYASGALREAPSLIVATHLALCPDCRTEVGKCEAIGGSLLEQAESMAVSEACRNKVMAALGEQVPGKQIPAYDPFLCNVLPEPLRRYVGCGVNQVQWKKHAPAAETLRLGSCRCRAGKARLFRVKAGAHLPKHTHKGPEYTLVLAGSLTDENGTYSRGDFVFCESGSTHTPQAGAGDDCICLVVMDGRIRLSGMIGRLISPFIRF